MWGSECLHKYSGNCYKLLGRVRPIFPLALTEKQFCKKKLKPLRRRRCEIKSNKRTFICYSCLNNQRGFRGRVSAPPAGLPFLCTDLDSMFPSKLQNLCAERNRVRFLNVSEVETLRAAQLNPPIKFDQDHFRNSFHFQFVQPKRGVEPHLKPHQWLTGSSHA